ncbi:hypothetical protein D3C78_470430 [compost metagenome]
MQLQLLGEQHAALVTHLEAGVAQRRDRVGTAQQAIIGALQLDGGAGVGILQGAQGVVGQEVLHEHLLLPRIQPGEVGLVVGVDPCHQLYIGAVVVGQVAIPGQTEVTVAPAPLLLARGYVVIRHVQQAAPLVMAVGTDEVVVGLVRHVGGGHRDVAVTGDIDPGGVIHLVVGATGDGEGAHVALAVVIDGGDIGREDALVGIAPLHRRIGPPEEVTRGVVAVEHLAGDLDQRLVRVEGKAGHHLQAAHRLHLAEPDGLGAALVLLDGEVHRHKGGGPVVLGPVELDAAGDPGPHQPHQRRLDHLVVVDKVPLHHLVVGAVDAPAQLR